MTGRSRTPSSAGIVALLTIVIGMTLIRTGFAAPTVLSAASRLVHAGHPYDVALPQTGGNGIECRDISRGATIALKFSEPITSAIAAVSAGQATVGQLTMTGAEVLIPLSSVGDAQAVTIRLKDIIGQTGAAPDVVVNVRFLAGDVNADGVVNRTDIQLVNNQTGKAVDGSNLRLDLNLNGVINGMDSSRLRNRIGATVKGGATSNTAPTISRRTSADQVRVANKPVTVPLSLADPESDSAALFVTATSSNQKILPNSAIAVLGDGTARILTLRSPLAKGNTTVTVNVSDGLSNSTLIIPVAASTGLGSTPYIGVIRPQSGVSSGGSGASTLMLSLDETTATIKYNYTNLTSPVTSKHIRGPADAGQTSPNILFDLSNAVANSDGSFTWTIVPVAGLTAQQVVDAIKQNRTYVSVNTATYPNGEVRGQYVAAQGDTTFTPPPPPPALPGGPLTDADAGRFLIRATYGPSEEDINRLKAMGIDAWLEQQFNMPRTSHLAKFNARIAAAGGEGRDDDDLLTECWWNIALTSPDQLRQRVAYAMSQIFVISQVDGDITGIPYTAASYYDMLADNAFRNLRKTLEDVTLHPAMGQYLDLRASKKADPNENYPRELLQLFSIGLYKMHPDGSLILNQYGEPIPTYDQDAIIGVATALTGWNWHQASTGSPPTSNYFDPMTPVTNDHEISPTAYKTIFDGIVLPPGQTAQVDLANVLNELFKHPNTGPFICRQLIQRMVCSNPSPGYVYRVSKVFADNGDGVRGDMRAVVKAILTDYESRATGVMSHQEYGKLREPVLRTTHLMRALHVGSNSGLYRMRRTDTELSQTPLRASTVFNFFEPGYTYIHDINPADAVEPVALGAPELQITSEIAAMNAANFLWNGIRNANNNGTFKDGDLFLDLSTERALAITPSAASPTALVDRLNKILMAGQMSAAMHTRITQYVGSLASTTDNDKMARARAAVQLVVTSPEFTLQK